MICILSELYGKEKQPHELSGMERSTGHGSFSWLNNFGKDFKLLYFLLCSEWLTQSSGDTQRPEWRESRVLGESLQKKTMGRDKRHFE